MQLISNIDKHNNNVATVVEVATVKLETLASGKFDEFGELGLNRQTLTFQSKATKQNKHLPTYKSATVRRVI